MTLADDEVWMRRALVLAERAASAGEVPIGAVLVRDGQVLGEGWNCPIGSHDPTAHAEVQAIRVAARGVGNYRLPESTLYVTLEPCAMCVGALVHARISRLVFGAREPRAGAVCSQAALLENHPFNWAIDWEGGVLESECSQRLSDFFRERRKQQRQHRDALDRKSREDSFDEAGRD